ncbi:imidazole glycerol phosphate synthase subunit HisH [Helicobacter sp. MIT 99-5507]|uniref:imidazole glycerol phosphate synthase subunit HisH n=1 Tax=Helicobacter sp. MIT 99-5507 TaxID=152489 RepID=UPI000E1EA6C3|nr:imidazole glycerol phosphate synthase subunit HisH [Helicobacter sp. MIT 99-5507]RDU57479.1 imidazole glycerol phosphate synthase subunit HisH [Helicobacter sp. MIT 99-5507]
MKVAILNYNIGNLANVKNALQTFDNVFVDIVCDVDLIASYDKVILPGVGAFENAMKHLRDNNMDEAIYSFIKSGKHILGICLGMQLLFDKSYEFGEHLGLGLISGEVVKFRDSTLKIPHIGWNMIDIKQDRGLLKGIKNNEYFYFVHSYYVEAKYKENILAMCNYGKNFSAIVQKDNIFGIQFHPEKSSNAGLKILNNFINL